MTLDHGLTRHSSTLISTLSCLLDLAFKSAMEQTATKEHLTGRKGYQSRIGDVLTAFLPDTTSKLGFDLDRIPLGPACRAAFR
jgi:hypothetical protein